jgi:bifunctional non-homologous end joining protein LigD
MNSRRPVRPPTRPRCPGSAPIDWDQLHDPTVTADPFTIRSIIGRLGDKGDLFRDVLDRPQRLLRLA